jgi:hypothetical protein
VRAERSSALAWVTVVSIVSSAAARLSTSSGDNPASALARDCSRVRSTCAAMSRPRPVSTTETARPSSAPTRSTSTRVGQAEDGAQLRYRSAINEFVHRGECGRGRGAKRCNRFDGGVHPVCDNETQRTEDVGRVLAT